MGISELPIAVRMMVQDLCFALRMLGKNPGFTAIAVLTLAIGIAANTAMFSVISAVLLEPLPYKDVAHLMVISEKDEKRNQVQPYSLSYVNFLDWRGAQRSFSELALVRRPILYKLNGRNRTLITARMVSGNFLSMLGIAPIAGRGFTPDDDRPGATPAVILSYSGWQKLFGPLRVNRVFSVGYSTNVINEKLEFNGSTYAVIGVLGRTFTFYTSDSNQNADAYIPIGLAREPWTTERARRPGISALGRLKPNITRAVALTELEGIARQLVILDPVANENRGAAVDPIFESVVNEDLRTTLYLLTAAVGLVLLIACGNVANLLLARGAARQKEIAIRSALGGGRWRLARQWISESVILALAGGAAGLVVAIAGTDLLVITAPVGLPRINTVGLDSRVLVFSVVISILTGIGFGFVPTLQALRANVQAELKEGGSSSVASRLAVQKILIIGEVALALVLLLSAGLVLRSTRKALSIDPGFDPTHVWNFRVVISPTEYATGREIRNFFRQLETRLTAMPEIRAVSLALGGLPKPVAIDPDYLRLMGIRLLKGRFFDARDIQSSPPVIVIDDVLARSRFRNEEPVGKSFAVDFPGARAIALDRPREIIGVVSHIQRLGIETDDETLIQSGFYLSTEQLANSFFEAPLSGVLIKSNWLDDKIQDELEKVVHAINPNAEVTGLLKMEDAVEFALAPRRFVTKLLSVFALIAFALAAMGIFGLMTYSVSLRTQEIGVRMALGAEAGHVVKTVVKQAAALAGAGIGLGLLASFWLTRFVGYLLFEVSAFDPITYAIVPPLLFSVALAAACIPAFRATRLEPMMALRGFGRERIPAASRMYPSRGGFTPEFSIEVLNLQKIYAGFRGKKAPAVSGVSFGVEPGTIFGLIGQNGAGKTTLVKILLGLTKPTTGSARLLGCSPGDPIANRQIGYLPEAMRIPDHFVAENFLRYMGKLNSVDSATLDTRVPVLLEKVGLGGVRKPVKTYSKGMQQRLGLAQALVNDPQILFLDEPTDGLDPLGRIFVRDLLIQLRAEGKTIFLNSHLLSEVELVCDRIIILDKGVVARTTTPSEFTRGTGEYIMRVDRINEDVQRVAASVIASVICKDGALRFTPRDTDQLNQLLDALRRDQVRIVSLEPVRTSLEQFFIQVVTTEKDT